MSNNFGFDTEGLLSMQKGIVEAADLYKSIIDDIYTDIDNLGLSDAKFKGPAYDNLKQQTDKMKPEVLKMETILRLYDEKFSGIQKTFSNYINDATSFKL